MDNSSSFRAQLSFLASVLLHGAAVFFLALGPMFLSSKKGEPDSHAVSFSVETSKPPEVTSAIAPPVVEQAAPPIAPPQPIVEAKPTPKAVAIAKPVAVKKAASKKAFVAKELPQKEIAPQEVLAAENTEAPLEKTESKTVESSDVVVAENKPVEKTEKETVAAAPVEKEIATEDEEVAPKAADAEFNGDKPVITPVTAPVVEEAPKAVEPAPLPAPVIKSQSTNSAAQPVAQAATAAPAGATDSSSSITAASTASGVAVTQSYLGLKQMSGNKPPTYSHEMRVEQAQGAGQLVYYVGKDGSVSQLKLTKSTGYADLDKAAIDAFSKYKFVPGQDGFTVHNFEFSLKGPAISDTGRLRTTMK